MEIIANSALRLQVRNPTRITTVIPKSKQTGPNEVLVHWGVEETHALRDLNIKAPAPIAARYNWPGQHKPMAHQKTTAEFLTMHRRAFCFSDMGTGKTASAIWAADFLMTYKHVRRVLVVCPVSIMDSAWRADLFTFAMHRTVDIAHGAAPKRKKIVSGSAEFVIINYDGISIVEEEIRNGGFDLIIVDEATHYKNTQSKRWKTLARLLTPSTWLWLMTGTPASQSPTDAYGLAKLVNPTGVPKFFGAFRDMVQYKVTQFRWENKPTAVDTVHRVLQPAIRFTKEDCLDLPDMVYTHRHVPLTPQQARYYKKLKADRIMQAAGAEVTAQTAAVTLNKLLQISAGAVYTDEQDTLEFDISSRYSVLQEIISETSKKLLVFVPYKNALQMLHDALTADGITTEMVYGDVSASARTDIFKRFQTTPDPHVLLIQPQAAAHGVTLTAANTVVWWGPTASLETYAQANARVHRKGQADKCTVVHLESTPVEKKLYKMLAARVDIHAEILSLYKDLVD